VIPVTVEHGIRAGLLPGSLQDPCDRMLIAQALAENLPFVSNDRGLDGYGVKDCGNRILLAVHLRILSLRC
jgi:PIN domain nuclease of toxin-antitoxin system